ncbi:MAG: ABC transporter permease [Natronosporangium sp.]
MSGRSRDWLRSLHAEWTKLRTTPSTGWLLLAGVAFTVAVGAATASGTDPSRCPPAEACIVDTTRLSLTGVWLGQAAVVVLAVLAATNEYGSRLVHTTLAANPRRGTVLLTRAVVVTGAVLGAGAVAVAGSLLAGRIILAGNGFPPPSLADGPALRAAAGTVLYFGLVGLLGLGVGTVVRDSAGAVTAVLALLYGFPVVATFLASDPEWYDRLQRIGPTTAGLAIQVTVGLDELPIGPWAGLGVLAGYAGAAVLLGALLFRFRDA